MELKVRTPPGSSLCAHRTLSYTLDRHPTARHSYFCNNYPRTPEEAPGSSNMVPSTPGYARQNSRSVHSPILFTAQPSPLRLMGRPRLLVPDLFSRPLSLSFPMSLECLLQPKGTLYSHLWPFHFLILRQHVVIRALHPHRLVQQRGRKHHALDARAQLSHAESSAWPAEGAALGPRRTR